MKISEPLKWCSITCICPNCRKQDNRLLLITQNNWTAQVIVNASS